MRLITFLLLLCSTFGLKAQDQEFIRYFSQLKAYDYLSTEFVDSYLKKEETNLDRAMSELEVRETWKRNENFFLITSFASGPCMEGVLFTLNSNGKLIDHAVVIDACDMDGGNSRHTTFVYNRFKEDIIELEHEVLEATEEGETVSGNKTREYTYYSYLSIEDDGTIGEMTIPDNVNEDREFGIASMKLLRLSDLQDMSKEKLRLMRNEVFASYGHVFKSQDLQEYFGKKSWYQPTGDATEKLSDIEKLNVGLIHQQESK